ncbi:MAG: septum formation protein Maf [Burkholderiaceae bacterium]|nr:septum formation protein Maf [Burkholderiaceae bacterium]
MTLVLASGSPYRRELLARLRLQFEVVAPDVDETAAAGERPAALAARLARAKAQAVASSRPRAIVIGSDQVASLDGRTPIGKPGTLARAREQLRAASGRAMQFHTAYAVVAPGRPLVEAIVPVTVRFRELDAAEIDRYLELEQPLDCAGAARCEGLGISLLEAIHTEDPTALVGLPLIQLAGTLRGLGLSVP